MQVSYCELLGNTSAVVVFLRVLLPLVSRSSASLTTAQVMNTFITMVSIQVFSLYNYNIPTCILKYMIFDDRKCLPARTSV